MGGRKSLISTTGRSGVCTEREISEQRAWQGSRFTARSLVLVPESHTVSYLHPAPHLLFLNVVLTMTS